MALLAIGGVAAPPAGAQTLLSRKIDFATQTAPLGSGYTRDYGLGYSSGAGFGWINANDGGSRSVTADARYRPTDDVTDVRLETYIHMQKDQANPARWQLAVPAGTYDVTVAVGDPSYFDSVHRVVAESTVVVDSFTPSASNKFRTATARVSVTDGFLTLAPTGGTNTKIDYVDVQQVGTGTSTTTTSTTTTTTSTTTTTTPPTNPGGDGTINSNGVLLTSPDRFAVVPRLVLSGVNGQAPKPPRGVTVRNTRATAVTITNVRLTSFQGQSGAPQEFSLASPSSFTLQPGQSAQVLVRYTARFSTPTPYTERYGTLRITHSAGPEMSMEIAGLSANGSSGNGEPSLQSMLNVTGYSATDVTLSTNEINLGATRNPIGEEIRAPYFRRADASRPVELDMITRYRGRTSGKASPSGWNPRGTTTRNEVVYVQDPGATSDNALGPSAFNQTLMPITQGSRAFSPTGDFAVYSESFSTDDTKNHPSGSSTLTHNFRVYRADQPQHGTVSPNTYILAMDFGFEGSTGKNHDFQDTVFVLKNVVPVNP